MDAREKQRSKREWAMSMNGHAKHVFHLFVKVLIICGRVENETKREKCGAATQTYSVMNRKQQNIPYATLRYINSCWFCFLLRIFISRCGENESQANKIMNCCDVIHPIESFGKRTSKPNVFWPTNWAFTLTAFRCLRVFCVHTECFCMCWHCPNSQFSFCFRSFSAFSSTFKKKEKKKNIVDSQQTTHHPYIIGFDINCFYCVKNSDENRATNDMSKSEKRRKIQHAVQVLLLYRINIPNV